MTEELQNQIERYLFRAMTEEEECDFTARIDTDTSLKEEVELTAMIIAATAKAGRKQDLSDIEMLKQTSVDEIRKLTKGRKPKPVLKMTYWLATSAAVILLAFIINHFYKVNDGSEQLFATYYAPYHDDAGVHRGGSAISHEEVALLEEALALYTNGQYADALEMFDKMGYNFIDDIAVYKAVCLLETGKTRQSIRLLSESVERNGEGWEYYQDARWYLALSYIKAGRFKDARVILGQIVAGERVYADKANQLLNQLSE
jgi:tetratricopeptide (TPR) repeat protein